MRILLLTLALLACFFVSAAYAQVEKPTDNVYFPGYVMEAAHPLASFVPETLHPACATLMQGDFAAAAISFQPYVTSHPDELAPWIGYLQAIRGKRNALLPLYQKQAASKPTVANEFKLGVLAFYLFGERYTDGTKQGQARKTMLARLAQESLTEAYHLSHDPAVGFMLQASYDYTSHYVKKTGDRLALSEDMIKSVGGEQVYRFYLQAKAHDWSGPPPPLPPLSRDKLVILRYIVGDRWAANSAIRSIVDTTYTNGKVQNTERVIPNSPAMTKASAYFGQWRQQLVAATQ